jgi:excisionase family DNA binding protein
LPGLNEFYKYIEKQETRDKEGTKDTKDNATPIVATANTVTADAIPAAKEVSGTKLVNAGGVRYILRNGMTVPAETEQEPESGLNGSANGSHADETPLPAVAFPNGTTLEDAVAMWQKLPRHIQLLASIEVSDREEVAQKYYTRGFRETRQQLIERMLNPTLTLEETARVLGVCPATVRRYTNRGTLPHYRTVGQQRRFRLSDVLTFLEQQRERDGRSHRKEAA